MESDSSALYNTERKSKKSTNGVNVVIEVIAIVLEEEWGIRDLQKFNVKTRKELYLK